MFVKVVRMPGAVVEVAIVEGSTIQSALDAADMAVGSNEKLTLNGSTVDVDAEIQDGDRIVLAKEAKSA